MQNTGSKRSTPSNTDIELLSVLWIRGTATAREIHQDLVEKGVVHKTVAYTTVRTYLDRLVQKGLAAVEDTGDSRGTLRYSPIASQEAVQKSTLDRIVPSLNLRPVGVLQWFHDQGRLSRKDLERLDELLKKIPDSELAPESQSGD